MIPVTIARLLSYHNHPFGKGAAEDDPDGAVAFQLKGDGTSLAWSVADGVLTLTPNGGTAAAQALSLSNFSVTALAAWLAGQPGYSVSALNPDLGLRSALILIDGSGTVGAGSTVSLLGYQSLLWAYLGAMAQDLTTAKAAIEASLLELSTAGADGEWLDLIGSYYGVLRQTTESDALYGPRIITEVEKAKGNNKAMERAMAPLVDATVSSGAVTVSDAPLTNGSYGWFDITAHPATDQPLDFQAYTDPLLATMNRLRDAGTNLRVLAVVRPISGLGNSAAAGIAGEITSVNPAITTALDAPVPVAGIAGSYTADRARVLPLITTDLEAPVLVVRGVGSYTTDIVEIVPLPGASMA
ncbi:MAG: hypothetical protein P4M00_25430 [Azospirillaceae bacterium]|nr:hypothetical protein [Azospirillaceae bacterium]